MKKRTIILIAAGAALLCAAVFIPLAVINSKTVKVAFYGVGTRVQDSVKSEIESMNLGRVRYYVLDDSAALPSGFEKKYSLLVAKNSLAVKNEAAKFIPVGEGLMESFPISIRKSTALGERHYAIPILLDNFEIAYYMPAMKNLELSAPRNYGGLLRYLKAVKKTQEIPLACAGAEDKDLLGFVSVMAEILYGAEDYKKMLEMVKESAALNKSALPESLTRVLDEIKAMQEKGFLFPQWTKASPRDVSYFMQERKLGASAMFLSERRDFEYNLIKFYEASLFPRYDNSVEHGALAPQIVAALLNDKNGAHLILGQLASVSAQENLTNFSLLAPTSSRAESVDRQADDVRFWAASSAAGALGGIEEECEVLADRRRLLAKKIRVYLES